MTGSGLCWIDWLIVCLSFLSTWPSDHSESFVRLVGNPMRCPSSNWSSFSPKTFLLLAIFSFCSCSTGVAVSLVLQTSHGFELLPSRAEVDSKPTVNYKPNITLGKLPNIRTQPESVKFVAHTARPEIKHNKSKLARAKVIKTFTVCCRVFFFCRWCCFRNSFLIGHILLSLLAHTHTHERRRAERSQKYFRWLLLRLISFQLWRQKKSPESEIYFVSCLFVWSFAPKKKLVMFVISEARVTSTYGERR